MGVVHLVDHSIRVCIEVREAALCVGRSTGAADLFRHVRLVRHWRGVSGASEGRSRGARSAVAAGSRGGVAARRGGGREGSCRMRARR